ncbi:MAG: hypothetical protein R3353_10905 [Salegentibacter mishustinae]|nr:hypothetical protein [Salegentibacter mishustinae]
MKKFILLILFFLATIISCTNNDDEVIADSQLEVQNACMAAEPLALDWIQDLKEELNCGEYACEVSILKSEYEDETVFYVLVTDPLCNSAGVRYLYNCFGEIIKEFTVEENAAFLNDLDREVETIFSCNDFQS